MTKEQILVYHQECLDGKRNPRKPIHLQHWFRKYGLLHPRTISKPLTEEQLQKCINLHKQGLNFTEIGKKLNIKQGTVALNLTKRGYTSIPQTVLQRKYKINETFFDVIDTEEKAYFLGLLYADGCVYLPRRSVLLTLNWKDKELLEKLNKLIYPNKKLRIVKARGTTEKMYSLQIYSKHVSNTVIEKGCIEAKTHTLQFPIENQVPEYLHNHFIRGHFDGDGCISTNISMVGNVEFIEKVQEILMEKCNLNKTKLSVRRKESPNIVTMTYGGTNVVKRIRDYLYKDATIFLQRKWSKLYTNQ